MLPNRLKSIRMWCLAVLVCVLFLNNGSPAWAQDTPQVIPQAEGDQFWDDRFGFMGIEGQVMAMAVAPNGDLYVGGDFTMAGGVEAQNIARWDGRTWHPLGAGLNGYVRSIAIDGGDVYVAGSFVMAGSVTVGQLARWNGQSWARVGGGGGPVDEASGFPETGAVHTLLAADGGLYVGGNFTRMDGAPGNNIIFWNGQGWSALGDGVGLLDFEGHFVADGDVRALAHDGNHLYVAGIFDQTGDGAANAIARWDGVNWSPLGAGLTHESDGNGFDRAQVTAIALHKGKLYAGGVFNRADGRPAARLAAWNGTSWSEAGEGVAVKQFSSDNGVNTLVSSGDYLYVGGNFIAAGGQPLSLLARWDGAAWSGLGDGIHDEGFDSVLSLAATANGGVYIGGSYLFADDLRVDNIALWNGADWRALGGGLVKFEYGDTPAATHALTHDGAGRVYAGGDFRVAGGVKVENLALWDGTGWRNIGGANDTVRALAVAGDDLYIGGDFTEAGGIAANHVARWNRITGAWSALGNGVNGVVNALTFANGRLYVGGNFTAAGAASAYDLALWDGAAWHPFGVKARIYERSQEGGEVGTYVNALAVAGDMVYVAGHFQTIHYGLDTSDLSSFVVVHNLVGWDSRNDRWLWAGTPLNPGVSNNGYSGFGVDANTLALIGDTLYVGGAFNQAGTVAANHVAGYNIGTGQWSAPGNSVGGFDESIVYTLAPYGTDLFVGGHFTSAGAAQARFVARFDTLTSQWSALGSGLRWYNDQFTEVTSLTASEEGVYVGGSYDAAGGRAATGFARWGGPLAASDVTNEHGGAVNGPDGLKVQFPAGAAADDLIVRLADLNVPRQNMPSGLGSVRHFHVAATTMTGQSVTRFLKPYTLRVPYTDAQLAAAGVTDPTTLNLLTWDGAAWQALLPCAGCGVDTTNKTIMLVADHFGEFALAGAAEEPGPGPQPQIFLPLVQK